MWPLLFAAELAEASPEVAAGVAAAGAGAELVRRAVKRRRARVVTVEGLLREAAAAQRRHNAARVAAGRPPEDRTTDELAVLQEWQWRLDEVQQPLPPDAAEQVRKVLRVLRG